MISLVVFFFLCVLFSHSWPCHLRRHRLPSFTELIFFRQLFKVMESDSVESLFFFLSLVASISAAACVIGNCQCARLSEGPRKFLSLF